MRFLNGGGFVFVEDFSRYCRAAFDRLYDEGADVPGMLSVGLYLRIIGRPAHIGGFGRFLDHARARVDVWFALGDEIAHHWRAGLGLVPRTRRPDAGFDGSAR